MGDAVLWVFGMLFTALVLCVLVGLLLNAVVAVGKAWAELRLWFGWRS